MEKISEIAARWVVRADTGSLSREEELELESWLAADPRHHGAWVRARAQWADLDRLATMRGPAAQVAQMTTHTQAESETEVLVSRRQLLVAGIAAATVLGSGVSWVLMTSGRERYATGIGEVRRIPLGDGSIVTLNTDTEIIANLTRHQRNIRLSRGEALFEVAHDRLRPFIVNANNAAVRAVGTAFSVRLEATRIDVTVTEGVVEVSDRTVGPVASPASLAKAPTGNQRVKANERVILAPARSPEVKPIAVVEANRQLAWREGMVSFDGETLQTAVNEINRHNHRQILIDDPLLGERPVVGVFRTNDLEGFAAAAEAAFRARAVTDGDFIRLERAVPDSR